MLRKCPEVYSTMIYSVFYRRTFLLNSHCVSFSFNFIIFKVITFKVHSLRYNYHSYCCRNLNVRSLCSKLLCVVNIFFATNFKAYSLNAFKFIYIQTYTSSFIYCSFKFKLFTLFKIVRNRILILWYSVVENIADIVIFAYT